MLSLFVAVLLFSISTTITPGPNNIMVMTSGLNFGVKRTLPHFLGICLGFPVMVIVVGVGFGAVFIRFPIIHEFIKYLGAAYLLYLAWKIACSHNQMTGKQRAKPLTFLQASLFQWVNPKAWVMAVGSISAYTKPELNMYLQVLVISVTFLVVCFPNIGIWMVFGAGLKRFLKHDNHQKIFNYCMGLLLVISVALIFIE